MCPALRPAWAVNPAQRFSLRLCGKHKKITSRFFALFPRREMQKSEINLRRSPVAEKAVFW